MQINVVSPRENKLKFGDVELRIYFNNKEVYRIDLSYLINRLNQINVFFKAHTNSQNLVFKLVVKHDLDNSFAGCNGVLDLKSIILKEDAIPYDDKVYVISTTNISTKKFFNSYFNINK